jgi:acyl carrier protein
MIADDRNDSSAVAQDQEWRERGLIAVVSELVKELQQQSKRHVDVSLSSQLDRDLGIDSLGRTELILRIERAFRVRLPIQVVSEANTVGDVLAALEQASPDHLATAATLPTLPTQLPLVQSPTEAQTLVEVLDWHLAQHPDRRHATVL